MAGPTSRRYFLQASLLSGCLASISPLSRGADSALHETLVDAVRALNPDSDKQLRLLLPEGSESNVLPIIDWFSASTGIEVLVDSVGVDEINSALLLAKLTGRRKFDVALPATFGIPDLAEAGALLPLDRFAGKYQPASQQNESLYSVGDYYRGKLYGYQADGDVYLMFYNAAFLKDESRARKYEDRYGEALALPRSWPELDRLLGFFHDPQQGLYGGALFRTPGYIAWEYWMRLHSKGEVPFDEEMRPRLDSDASIDALAELTNVSRYLHPGATRYNLFENWQAFADGNTFCNVGWGGSQKYYRRHAKHLKDGLLYSHAPGTGFAHSKDAVSFFNWGWNYAVPESAAEPELAYLFALYAASPAMSTLAVRQPDGYFDPLRPEHYDDPEIQAVYSQPFLDAHRSAMANAIPDLYLRGQSQYMATLSDYIIQADQRQISPAEAMRSVAKLWDGITDQLGRKEQARQWRALLAQYPAGFKRRVS